MNDRTGPRRAMPSKVVVLSAFAWTCLIVVRAAAETPAGNTNNMIMIPRLTAPAKLNTDLKVAPWTQAARVAGFLAIGGETPVSEPASVYLFYDSSSLWTAYRFEGRGRSQLKTDIKDRDGPVWRDDSADLLLSPRGSTDEHYQIVANFAGVVYDAHSGKKEWNANVGTATVADEKGWTVVLRVPFADLGVEDIRRGDVWRANFCHGSSRPERSTWAPVYEAFVEPDRFGRIVFGDEKTRPIRIRTVGPVTIGVNEVTVDPVPGLRFEITGFNASGRGSAVHRGEADEAGVCRFTLSSDDMREIAVVFRDGQGRTLAECRLPITSPQVAGRVAPMEKRFAETADALSRFPSAARTQVDALLKELKPRLDDAARTVREPARHTAANWERLKQTVADLELRLDGPWTYVRTLATAPKAAFAVGFASPMQKVLIRDFPFEGVVEGHYDLSLARNEHEAVQVVVMPYERDLRNASVSVSALRSKNGGRDFAGGEVTVSLVGHVKTEGNTPYEVSYTGWWPDPLLNFLQKADVRAGEHVAFWVDVSTSPRTLAGEYGGTITVTADDCAPVTLGLNVRVWDLELPKGTHLRNAFTYDEHQVRKIYGDKWTRELAYKYYDLILDHRLNIDHLYRGGPPDWEVIKYGVAKGMSAFNIINLGHGGLKGEREAVLDEWVPRLKAAGLLDKAYVYGFDEVKGELFKAMRDTFGEVHRRYPGLRTMTTAQDTSFGRDNGLRDAVDIWVPLTPSYSLPEAEKLRKEGKAMWWYVCVVPRPPYANWFVESAAIEARLLMGPMTYKYKADGVLYYLITLWRPNRKPISSGPYTEWKPGSFFNEKNSKTANGDGSLICPGPDGPLSTIRFENIRDGLEDYEYLWLLAERAAAVRKAPATPAGQAYLKQADELLAVPDAVVRDVREYTRDPKAVDAFRAAVAKAIEQGGALIGTVSTPARSK